MSPGFQSRSRSVNGRAREVLPLPGRVGHQAVDLARQVEAGARAQAEGPRLLLQRRSLGAVELVAQLVEVGVARDLERLGQVHEAVRPLPEVREDRLVELDLRRRLDRLVGRDEAVLQARRGADRLEGRPGRVLPADGPVEEPVRRVGDDVLDPLLGAADEQRGVVVRVRGHREDLARVRVEGDAGAAGGEAVERDLLGQRVLQRPLRGRVDRQLHVAARARRVGRDDLAAGRLAGRVNLAGVAAGGAAQEALVLLLDAALADGLVAVVAPAAVVVELLGADLPRAAEDVRGEPALGVGAQEAVAQPHAGELALALGEVVRQSGAHVLGHDDGLEGPALARVDPLLEVGGRDAVELAGQAVQHLLPARAGQLARVDHQVGAGAVAHQQLAVAVEDLAAGRVGDDGAQAVALGGLGVLLAADHLEEPEAHQQQPQQRERDCPEHRDAHGRARGQRGCPAPGRGAGAQAGAARRPRARGHVPARRGPAAAESGRGRGGLIGIPPRRARPPAAGPAGGGRSAGPAGSAAP